MNTFRIAGQIFDPAGCLSQPYLFRLKLLYSNICQKSKSWDEIIPCSDLQRAFKSYLIELQEYLQDPLVLKRNIFNEKENLNRIHLVVDGSQHGYSFSIYLLTSNEQGKISSHIIYANSAISRHNVGQVFYSN